MKKFKKIIFLLVGILGFIVLHAQDQQKYNALVKEAQQLYKDKKYAASGQKYAEAFTAFGNKGYIPDRYNAARSWTQAKIADSAFVQLFRIASKGNYTNYDQITKDKKLKFLHSDNRWLEVSDIIKSNKEKIDAKKNKQLIAILDTIYKEDQTYRVKITKVEKNHGYQSKQIQALWKIIHTKDSINEIKVRNILDTYGWLGPDVVGDQGNSTLFLVIQHSPLKTQEKYLPMMREAVKNRNATASSLALLEDRVALKHGKRQIYGSQIGTNSVTGVSFIFPLEDLDNVNKRRAEVGLQPIEDYLKIWNMKWNVEQYKKDLPELEKKTKQNWKE